MSRTGLMRFWHSWARVGSAPTHRHGYTLLSSPSHPHARASVHAYTHPLPLIISHTRPRLYLPTPFSLPSYPPPTPPHRPAAIHPFRFLLFSPLSPCSPSVVQCCTNTPLPPVPSHRYRRWHLLSCHRTPSDATAQPPIHLNGCSPRRGQQQLRRGSGRRCFPKAARPQLRPLARAEEEDGWRQVTSQQGRWWGAQQEGTGPPGERSAS